MPLWFTLTYLLLWIVVAITCTLLLGVLHHLGQVFDAVRPVIRPLTVGEPLLIDAPLPPLAVEDVTRGKMALPARDAKCGSLLLLAQRRCEACDDVLNTLETEPTLRAMLANEWQMRVVVLGELSDAADLRSLHPALSEWMPFLADSWHRVPERWGVGLTPYMVIVDEAGIVRRKLPIPSGTVVLEILKDLQSGRLSPVSVR